MSESASHSASHDGHAPPPLDEPKSPMWLPALGAALFIAVGLWWAVTPSPPPPPPDDTEPAAAAPQPAASAGPRPAAVPGAAGGAQGAGGPDNAALQRILEKLPKQ